MKFPALAVLLMVSVLPVIPVAELSRPTLAAPLMLSELPDTAPVDDSVAPATVPVAVSAAQETAPEASMPVVNTSVQFTLLHSSWSVAAHVALRGEPVQCGQARQASESASRSVTETDSLEGAGPDLHAVQVQRARRLLHQPGNGPAEGSEVQLRNSAQRRQEVQARCAPDALRGRAEEGAGDAYVIVVGSELASRDASISGLQASKADASALTAYALQSAVDTSSEVDSKIAAALLNAVTTAALDAALLAKADASALASLLSTVDGLDTPLEVDTKRANALLGLATEAFVAAQLASRDAGITALQASKADTALLASYATTPRSPPARPRSSRAPLTQSSRSSPPCSFPAAELLTRRPGRASQLGSSFAEAASFATCISWLLSLLRWPTASIMADCYSTAGTDAGITAALLAYYTSSQVDTLLGDYRTGAAQDAETTSAIGRTAGLLW